MNNSSILIIDDKPDNFEVIETFLETQNYFLHYASSGEDIETTLSIYNPDLILLDVMMPKIDGLQVCHQIKSSSQWKRIPIIMVTALDSKSDLANCINAGADDFIGKPINAVELRARVRSMLRIKHHYDSLQNLLKSRQDMVNMVVHDLRNPLSNILIGLEILSDGNISKEKQERKLGQIYSSAKNLQVLIDDLLKIALFESDKLHLNLQEANLGDLIKSSVSSFEAIANQKKQSIKISLPSQITKTTKFDFATMHRAIDNILSNASKYSPSNSQINVILEYLDSGQSKIQIIDLGIGISQELQNKIFEKYEIGSPIDNVAQVGLGLAFCKMVVESHGGTIGVKSNQPNGCIFEIVL